MSLHVVVVVVSASWAVGDLVFVFWFTLRFSKTRFVVLYPLCFLNCEVVLWTGSGGQIRCVATSVPKATA